MTVIYVLLLKLTFRYPNIYRPFTLTMIRLNQINSYPVFNLILAFNLIKQFLSFMTSPKKSFENQKDSTLFGQLSQIEKQTTRLGKELLEGVEVIKRYQAEFTVIEKQSKYVAEQSKVRLTTEIHVFQSKIKNHLVTQKAEYIRVATQITQIIAMNKDINAQLQVLNNRYQQFAKNVGV